MNMTRAEAIEILKAYKQKLENSCSNQLDEDIKAFDMAIEALKMDEKNAKYGSELARIVAEHEEVSDV